MGLREFRFKIKRKLRIRNKHIRDFFSEFLGTFIFIIFGVGVNAQTTLGKSTAGEYLSVSLGWGWGLAMGVWVSGGVSGGHLNPAVSLACAILGRLKLIKLPIYILAQLLGAFVASACIFGIYYDALNNYDGGVRAVTGENATAGIWATYPQDYVSTLSAFGDQVFGTFLLVLGIMSLTDNFNMAPTSALTPLGVGGLLAVIAMAFGLNAGFAINPARDFGPRAFTACAGYGVEVFTAHDYYFWVPMVAPLIGAICGAWAYQLLVGIHTEKDEEDGILPISIDNKDGHHNSNVTALEIVPDYDK